MQMIRETLMARLLKKSDPNDQTSSTPFPLSRQFGDFGHRIAGLLFGQQSAGWILPILKPHFRPIVVLALFTTLASLLGLLVPYFTKLVIDEALIPGDFNALLVFVAGLFITGIVALLTGMFNSLLHLRFSVHLLNDLRSFLLQKILQMQVREHVQQRVGEILGRIDGDASQLQRFSFDALLSGGGALVRLIGSVGFMLWLDWRLAVIAILAAPVELLFLIKTRPKTRQRAEEVREQRGLLASLLGETIAAVPVLQAMTAEPERFRQYRNQQQNLTDALIRQRLWTEWTGFVPSLLSALVRGSILLYGGYRVIQGDMQLGSLIAFLSYLAFLLGPLKTLLGIYHAQARVRAAISRLDKLALMDEIQQSLYPPEKSECTVADIEINQLKFNWPGSCEPIVDIQSLLIPAGSKVLLTGESGTGKSTLCSLISRFHLPVEGQIRYAGNSIDRYDIRDLRQQLVLVPQKGFLFHGSVYENLQLVCSDLTEEKAWYVLNIVELAEWVKQQGGLHAEIGERALNISGGQNQRLSMARALLKPFRVIIFDESLSEVDQTTANKIIQNIDGAFPETTRIYVAHGNRSLFEPLNLSFDLTDNRVVKFS